jgi:hypothetical protein
MSDQNDPNAGNPPSSENKNSQEATNAFIKAMEEQARQREEINSLLEAQNNKLKDILKTSQNIKEVEEKTAKHLNESDKFYKSIDEKIKNIEENYDNIVDAEQILEETQAERRRELEKVYQLNQKSYLLLLEQIKASPPGEEKKRLEEQARILLERIKLQGQELKNDQEIRKGKEEILSLGRETLQLAKQYGFQLEAHIIQISKATGGYATINSNIREAGRLSQAATLGTGITGEQNQKALEALSSGFRGLTTYGAQAMSTMQVATAQLTKIGLDATTAAKGFDTLVNAMGKTPQQATKIQESFVQMASKNRLALSEVSQAFADNSSRFVGYGDKMIKVMEGLAEQSLKTGVQINNLINIAQGFDTFEDASRKVGTLNTLLGGDYFNSIEMLTASDEERISLLKEGVKASGMQWESLNRQQKQAIATAAGFKDLNDAAKMFGETSLSNTKQQREQAEVQKTLAEQAESVSLGMDKLKSTLNGLFIAIEPFVSLLMSVAGAIGWVAQKMNYLFSGFGEFPKIGAIVTSAVFFMLYSFTSLGGGIRMIGSAISGVVSKLFSLGSSLVKTGAQSQVASQGMAGGIRTIAMAATQGALGLLALGAALFLIGAGIGLAALGFSKLVESFASLTGPKALVALASMVVMMGGFIWILSLLTKISIPASIGMKILAGAFLVLGLSMLVVGAIIMGVSFHLAKLFDSMAKFFTTIKDMKSEDITKLFKSIFSELTSANINSLYSLSYSLFIVTQSLKSMLSLTDQLAKFIDLLSKLDDINAKINTTLNENSSDTSTIKQSVIIDGSGTPAIPATGAQSVAGTATKNTTTAGRTSPLIPAQQTVAYVPLVVQIDKIKIIEILKSDIEKISLGQTEARLDAMGLTQSAFYVPNRVSSQDNTG